MLLWSQQDKKSNTHIYPVSFCLPEEALTDYLRVSKWVLTPSEPNLMTRRSRHSGSNGVEDAHTTFFPILARWTSKEKTLWKRSGGEQANPSASAELSKLSEESGTGTV